MVVGIIFAASMAQVSAPHAAPFPTREAKIYVSEVEPFRVTNDVTSVVTVRGSEFASASQLSLLEATGASYLPLDFVAIDANTFEATVPTGVAAGSYFLVVEHATHPFLVGSSHFFVDPPLPIVTSLVPANAPSDATTPLCILGANLAGATSALFEGPAGEIIELESIAVVSSTEVDALVSPGLDPGEWTVRVVTPGGISVVTQGFQVDPPLALLPEIVDTDTDEATNDQARLVVLEGHHFTGATSVVARAASDTSLSFTVLDDAHVQVTIPLGLAADLYEFLVSTAAGSNATSEAKYLSIEPASAIDYFGDGGVLGVNSDTVRFQSASMYAVVERGRLAFLRNRLSETIAISKDFDPQNILGLEWDANSPTAAADTANSAFTGLLPNAIENGVDFRFDYQGIDAYTVTFGLPPAGDALECTLSYDTTNAALPGNVFRGHFGNITLPAGTAQLLAAFGGLRMDWNALFDSFNAIFPEFYDLPLAFLEDDAAGGVLVDLTALGEEASITTISSRSDGRSTRLRLFAGPHKSALRVNSLGPIRFVPTTGTWADALEPIQAAIVNPWRPSWLDTVTSVLRIDPLDPSTHPDFGADDVEALYDAIEPAATPPNDWRLLHATGADLDTSSGVNLPEWSLAKRFDEVAEPLFEAGWHVLPYANPLGIQEEHSLYPLVQGERLAKWDKANQTISYRFWDADSDGSCCEDPEDFWLMNPTSALHRAFVEAEISASRAATFSFDGIYLDFLKANFGQDERNPATGDVLDGVTSYVAELETLFGPMLPGEREFLIGTEGTSVPLVERGVGFAATHIILPGTLEVDPTGGFRPLAFSHPMGSHLILDECMTAVQGELGYPAWHQGQFFMTRLAALIQGVVPTGVVMSRGAWFAPTFALETKRSLVQIAEEGLYWRLHGVKPWTDPHALWSDPETLRVYQIDGAPVARTKDWFVKKLVCDLYWQFGGRAPTQMELDQLAGSTRADFLGVFAAACAVRALFQGSPTPQAEVQTRSTARAAILAVFPEYPAP